MSEYREGRRKLQERIDALQRENADLLAQLTETEAALVARDHELARATDQAPRPLLRYVLLPLVVMAAVFTALYFAATSRSAPSPAECTSASTTGPSALAPLGSGPLLGP